MERYICIHGHFYQPPRENPWLEEIEWQESAYPYHDWNERVTAECYLPNAASRILDGEGYISRLVSNYARMSFNFGPTLLAWMEKNDPATYRAIIESDREGRRRFSGHGPAIAQAYNHLIMPLANHRDRYSQVAWGIRDFEHRFGRKPEGMWLPETAVDLETLDIMAEQGLKFTILAPHQARRTRRIGTSGWKDVSGGVVDITRAYMVNLPSGGRINVFFFHGPIANAVSFQDILKNGDKFASTLLGAFPEKKEGPQLVHIATDGENYGHHHRFADMALAYALQKIEENKLAQLTCYGEFLEKNPPTHEAEIIEKTSWSCVHGVDRWWSDCRDTVGASNHPDWNQKWRTPLRNAFDFLRDNLAGKYEENAGRLLKDPWAARDGYIDVILDRSPGSVNRFFAQYAARGLNAEERATALKLLELQRHAMLMYTSCGWYFDEISRPEPVQVMQYAGRVVELARELFSDDTEEAFLKVLEQAKSNIPAQGDGRRVFENLVRPAMFRAQTGASLDEQRKTLSSLTESALTSIEKSFRSLFEGLYPPERTSAELGGPVPAAFDTMEKLVINMALHRTLRDFPLDAVKARALLDAATKWQVKLDAEGIGYDFKMTLEKNIRSFSASPDDIDTLKHLLAAVSLARELPFPVDLWKTQNIFWGMLTGVYPRFKQKAENNEPSAQEWVSAFIALGKELKIRVK
ncbi:MAG: hypothetical protein A2Y92_01135 [Chloroflexi bacterium RBG_13_57_8]|nr:MAG: hypothetical protein A2Y92_01135 [Chloroflexi bacterium RBG_13_57_8]